MASYASAMLAQFDVNMATLVTSRTGKAFKPSGYRIALDREPDSGVQAIYFLDLADGRKAFSNYGAGESFWRGTVNVQVGFARGGGDKGGVRRGGDRRNVLASAADDCIAIGDVLENPESYTSATSGIATVTFRDFGKDFDGKHFEVWRVTFDVEWRSAILTS